MANDLSPEQQPVNKPASGTYGEGVALDNLKKSLPQGAIGNPAPPGGAPLPPVQPAVMPTKSIEGRPSTGAALPPGVPSPLLAPTQYPNVPVTTPLTSPWNNQIASPQVQTPQQGRLLILDQLANSPDVSAETREWAQHVLEILMGGQGAGLG